MNGKQSIQNLVIILGALVLTALVAVLWPALAGAFGVPTGGGLETEMQTVTLPIEIFGVTQVNSLVIMGVLLVLVVALVGGGGATIAFLNTFVFRQVESVKESEEYKTNVSTLEKQEKELLQELREDRKVTEIPDHRKLGWSVVSTSLIILALVIAATTIVNRSLIPEESTLSLFSLEIGTRLIVSLAVLLITIGVLAWRMRESWFANMEELDNGPIPWDSIWIILTGLVVVGIGVGLMVYFNIPG